jgi:hypothetical protein
LRPERSGGDDDHDLSRHSNLPIQKGSLHRLREAARERCAARVGRINTANANLAVSRPALATRVIQRRAYGLRDEEYLRLKILTCMLPEL